ncbi:hypothetical protein [Methylobacter sp. sgz302048]|uniref:hypothetical protein n=1 Tax=Methylobacter sp. sgz302048 TaxID=3455945 RepID=UPI003FA10E03
MRMSVSPVEVTLDFIVPYIFHIQSFNSHKTVIKNQFINGISYGPARFAAPRIMTMRTNALTPESSTMSTKKGWYEQKKGQAEH